MFQSNLNPIALILLASKTIMDRHYMDVCKLIQRNVFSLLSEFYTCFDRTLIRLLSFDDGYRDFLDDSVNAFFKLLFVTSVLRVRISEQQKKKISIISMEKLELELWRKHSSLGKLLLIETDHI